MTQWQINLISAHTIFACYIGIKGLIESWKHKNPNGPAYYWMWMGIFVWADAVIWSPFWIGAGLISIYLNDWILACLIWSTFWVVRNLGETIYWFNQQYSTVIRQPPHMMVGIKLFHDDSIWFVYQIFHQALTVISIILTIYFTKLWLYM